MAQPFPDWSIRFRVISCAQKSLNCEVLNLKCTKELQNFASTKVLMVRIRQFEREWFIENFKFACIKVHIPKLVLLCTTVQVLPNIKPARENLSIFITILKCKRDEKARWAVLIVNKILNFIFPKVCKNWLVTVVQRTLDIRLGDLMQETGKLKNAKQAH